MIVTLTWQAVTPPATGQLWYNIYRATVSGGPYQLAVTNCTVLVYIDGPANLDTSVDYFYVVTSQTTDGESVFSNEYHAGSPPIPGTPLNLIGTVS